MARLGGWLIGGLGEEEFSEAEWTGQGGAMVFVETFLSDVIVPFEWFLLAVCKNRLTAPSQMSAKFDISQNKNQ